MRKSKKEKASAVSALKKESKPVAGRTAQEDGEPAPAQGQREAVTDEYGTEEDRGRKIPFHRTRNLSGVTKTHYGTKEGGEHVSSSLTKMEFPNGKIRWNITGDESIMRVGDAAKHSLNQDWKKEETQRLFSSVQQIALTPGAIDDDFDGKLVRKLLAHVISTGIPHQLDLLRKVILAVHCQFKKPTKRWLVAMSVAEAARQHSRVPMATEALQCFANAGGDADEKNFRQALKNSGFGWLIS